MWLTALLFAVPTLNGHAADDIPPSEQEWYQVEVIIFTRESGITENSEQWRDRVAPSYPENLQVLRQYQAPTVLQKEVEVEPPHQPNNPFIDLFEPDPEPEQQPIRADTIPTPEEEPPSFSQFDIGNEAVDTSQTDSAPPETAELTEPEQEAIEPINLEDLPKRLEEATDLAHEPFILLPDSYFRLSNLDRRIDRSLDMRLLSHVAWRQPVISGGPIRPVLIQTGKQYGLAFEVEGMLALRKNRYLHVGTDLVYSTFKRKLVNEGINWEIFGPERGTVSIDSYEYANGETGNFNMFADDSSAFETELTAAFKQTRRIREDELHYLDHPLFGILVQVSPYELPDPVLEMPDFDLDQLPQRKPLPELKPIAGTSNLSNSD